MLTFSVIGNMPLNYLLLGFPLNLISKTSMKHKAIILFSS